MRILDKEVSFLRYAVVVQNSGGISTFYATIETDILKRKIHKADIHFYLDTSWTY